MIVATVMEMDGDWKGWKGRRMAALDRVWFSMIRTPRESLHVSTIAIPFFVRDREFSPSNQMNKAVAKMNSSIAYLKEVDRILVLSFGHVMHLEKSIHSNCLAQGRLFHETNSLKLFQVVLFSLQFHFVHFIFHMHLLLKVTVVT